MNRSLHRATRLTILLMTVTVSGALWAQDSPETALDEAAEKIESKQTEANTDLRESVHENLETIQEDAQTSSDLKMAQDALQKRSSKAARNDSQPRKKLISWDFGHARPDPDHDLSTPIS